jgi:hypothetical protein
MKLFPVINFSLDESKHSPSDITGLYWFIIEAIDDWVCKDGRIDYLDTVEFSVNCPQLWQNVFEMQIKLWEGSMDMAFASVTTEDQLQKILKALELADYSRDKVKVFSPIFDKSFEHEKIEYIPGVYCKEDIDEVSFIYEDIDRIKIFPMQMQTPEDMLKILQGPFAELRKPEYRSRVITLSEEIATKYKVYERDCFNPNIRVITTPQNYYKIRDEFMTNKNMKLIFKPLQRDLQKFIEEVKWNFPRSEIILSGLGGNLEQAKQTKRINYLSTRMFNAVILDLLSGAINEEIARGIIASELDRYSTVSA